MTSHNDVITIEKAIVDEMNRILSLKEGLEDTKDGNTIHIFTAYFPNDYFADIKVVNGSRPFGDRKGSSPWIDCVLFDSNGGEVTCFIGDDDSLLGEYLFEDDENSYCVVIEEKVS